MLVETYIVVELLAFLFFFLSFKWLDQRVVFTAVSLVLFAMLGMASGSIEIIVGDVITPTNDIGLMLMNFLFLVLSLLYILAGVFGYAVDATESKPQGKE
jgi:hypothetical protein